MCVKRTHGSLPRPCVLWIGAELSLFFVFFYTMIIAISPSLNIVDDINPKHKGMRPSYDIFNCSGENCTFMQLISK